MLAPLATELPEKLNSVLWMRRDKDTLAVGNITGAMAFRSTVPIALGLAVTDWDLDRFAALLDCLGEYETFYDVVEYAEVIAPALDEFSPRDRLVLHLRFVEDMTQTEIAERIGVSQMQVSRILRSLLERLRDQVQGCAEARTAG